MPLMTRLSDRRRPKMKKLSKYSVHRIVFNLLNYNYLHLKILINLFTTMSDRLLTDKLTQIMGIFKGINFNI